MYKKDIYSTTMLMCNRVTSVQTGLLMLCIQQETKQKGQHKVSLQYQKTLTVMKVMF